MLTLPAGMIQETTRHEFEPNDQTGDGCFFLDLIVWLNSDGIELGDEVGFNFGCYVNGYGGLRVGDRTLFGPYVMIHTANHETDPGLPLAKQGWIPGPVEIGADCWIGMGAIILPGVTVGDKAIIGAGSVVTRDIPPSTVAVGNPARPAHSR